MLSAFSIALPLVLGTVLIASAVAKFRTPDDLTGWADLGVPAAFRREWLRQLHPWGELVLGLAIVVLGGWLGAIASFAAVVLMIAYTVLVARVAARADDTTCACFGARKRVTRVTVARNAWLTLLAIGSTAVVWMNPLLGGALAAGLPQWPWIVGLGVAAVTAAFVLWPDSATQGEPAVDAVSQAVAAAQGGDDELDYVRTRTPAVPVTLADGSVQNLRRLTARKPILLLSVSTTCGPCTPVIERVEDWRELLPEVDIRLLFASAPAASVLIETAEPQSLHDPEGYVRESLGAESTPTAVLLGIDGLLAGGPVTGSDEVMTFVGDVYESLHGERPSGDERNGGVGQSSGSHES